MVVSILKTKGEYLKTIRKSLELIDYKPKKDKIFLNPKHGLVTPLEIVEAVIEYFKPLVKEIVIGEGSVVGSDSMKVMKQMGYDKLAEKHGCKLVDLNHEERYKEKWKFGEIELPMLLKTHEYINLPVIKTHSQTTITVCTKNQKGLLRTPDKKLFHILGLNEPILELGKIVKPDLNIVSGIYCLQGNSISFFKSIKNLDIIVCGTNHFEVDNVCKRIMGINEKIEHFPYIEDIETRGRSIEEVRTKFKTAKTARKLFNVEFRTKGCSGCTVNIQKMLKLLLRRPFMLAHFFYYAFFKELTIVTGNRKQVRLPERAKCVLFLGNCTKCMAEEREFKYLDGCPPSPKQMLNQLGKFLKRPKDFGKK